MDKARPIVGISVGDPGGIGPATDADTSTDTASSPVRHNSFYTSPARKAEKFMLLDASLSRVLARYGTVHSFL